MPNPRVPEPMHPNTFADLLRERPRLYEILRKIAAPPPRRHRLGLLTDAVTMLFLQPVTSYLLLELDLPWHRSGGYTEEEIDQAREWVLGHFADSRDHAQQAAEVTARVMQGLEQTTDPVLREEWEGFASALREATR